MSKCVFAIKALNISVLSCVFLAAFIRPSSSNPSTRLAHLQILEAWSQTALVWALHLNHLPLSIAALEAYRATARVHHPRSLARLVLQLYLAIQVCVCLCLVVG